MIATNAMGLYADTAEMIVSMNVDRAIEQSADPVWRRMETTGALISSAASVALLARMNRLLAARKKSRPPIGYSKC